MNPDIKSQVSEFSLSEVQVDEDIRDLVPGFLSARREELEHMRNLVQQNRFDEIARFGHTWKGIARPYGFPTLENLSREIEEQSRLQHAEGVRRVFSQITQYIASFPGGANVVSKGSSPTCS